MSIASANPTSHADERNAKGQFKPGNKGGPGNPFNREIAALRSALLQRVTQEDVHEVANALLAKAKEGDVAAPDLLLKYTIGKPLPAVEPDRVDLDEWDIYKKTTPMKTEAANVADAGTPEYHLSLIRMLRPMIAELMRVETEKKLNETDEDRAQREASELAELERFLTKPCSPALNGLFESSTPNGGNGQAPPSPNGANEGSPSPNGGKGQPPPSPNGANEGSPPPNGGNGQPPPSPNGANEGSLSPNGGKRRVRNPVPSPIGA